MLATAWSIARLRRTEASKKNRRRNRLRMQRGRSALAAQQAGESVHLLRVKVGRHPVVHPATTPVQQIVAVMLDALNRAIGVVGGGPHEDVHNVLAALIDECSTRTAVEVVETAADETEAVGSKVINRRREID